MSIWTSAVSRPDAGCSRTVEGKVLTREQQADKPRLVVEVADEVWD